MSKIIEDLIYEYKKEWAIGIIKTGKLSYEEIAECVRLVLSQQYLTIQRKKLE